MLTGNPQMDAARAFDRAARARRRDVLLWRLRRSCAECAWLAVDQAAARRRRRLGGGVREIPLEAIVATVEPARARQFDRWFRPATRVARSRWERLWIAEQRGEVLPPIMVVEGACGYAVVDGHHRVSVARARGALTIDAVVSVA